MLPNCLLGLTIILASLAIDSKAYIPALPTNDTAQAIQEGLNVTDVSQLHLQWYSNGSYWENVSYQLVGNNSNGISKGALVHFSETKALNETTTTPWIALVGCDTNGTDYSLEDDIFTLARDRGAVSALLYSLYSSACIINPVYADPENFDQVLDIFSTQSLTSAHLIEYQFGQFGAYNESIYGSYDAQMLNNSAAVINATIAVNAPVAPGYLFATLRAYNATDDGDDGNNGNGDGGNSRPSSGNSTNTSLAMIVLYAITGCVSALFCIVIISGAIRAIRHPERYNSRMANRGGFSSMGARGLTRAILDTFPIVKFGTNSDDVGDGNGQRRIAKDVESPTREMEMTDWEVMEHPNQSRPLSAVTRHSESPGEHLNDGEQHVTDLASDPGPRRRPSTDGPVKQVVPAAIGRETCPICIVDFEEGDDLRVLPCEGNHRFHQTCVDPWLLELSSSCPICRQDFLALETILSGGSEDDHDQSFVPSPTSGSPQGNRFSRYLRFARRRRGGQSENHSPIDNDMPPLP